MMVKLLFVIIMTFSTLTNILFCEDICSNYNDQNCVHPNIIKNGHFINQWTVYLPDTTKEQARIMLEAAGFNYLGQIMDNVDLHLVTKKGTLPKHAMPNERIIELLKKHEKVHSVAQTHVLQDSKDDALINIIDENEVECSSFDPDTINLNDGSENLERIQASESTNGNTGSYTLTMSRPASNNPKSDTIDTDQTTDSNDNNINGNKKKRRRTNDEGTENQNEESNNVISSDDED